MSMVQDLKFPILSIRRSKKTPMNNEMVMFEVLVDGVEFINFNKFKIKVKNTPSLNWWKSGKKDITNDSLEIDIKDFIIKSMNAREGTQIRDGEKIGNFLIIDYTESNYLKISILEEEKDCYKLLMELVNFLAPYPLINDTNIRETKIKRGL